MELWHSLGAQKKKKRNMNGMEWMTSCGSVLQFAEKRRTHYTLWKSKKKTLIFKKLVSRNDLQFQLFKLELCFCGILFILT